MNPTPPLLCGTFLVALLAAGISHYWSVANFVSTYPVAPSVRLVPAPTPSPAVNRPMVSLERIPTQLAASPNPPEDPNSKEFFENLIKELRNLRNENRDLTDQIAETNRDVMKMQFQIDTHSESFRPLQVTDDRDDRSQLYDEDYPSVLPPRAQPVPQIEE